jgi:ubiquitin C-terminal hydrolase
MSKWAPCVQGNVFADGREHDSHEFLRFVMNVLHEAHDRVVEKPPYTEVLDVPDEAHAAKAQRMWDLQQAREASPVSDLFQGQLESAVVCSKCQTTFHTYEPFMDLSLSLNKEGTAWLRL